MTEEKKQHTVLLDASQSEAIARLAAQEGRSFNEQLRYEVQYALQHRRGRASMATPARYVYVKLDGDDDWRGYRNAALLADESRGVLKVLRGERVIASFSLNEVVHWDADEAEDES